jgi:hypothetical protein
MTSRQAMTWMVATLSLTAFATPARAATDATATDSATVLAAGPRSGNNGKNYLNAQGRKSGDEGKYASFGVIDFPAPAGGLKVGKVKGLTLTLTQSIPRFAKSGPIKFFLSSDTKTGLGPDASPLKFDPASADGLVNQLKPRWSLGSGTFTKDATGHVDTFPLTLDAEAESALREQWNRGGVLRLIVVPDNEDVAATYFGAGNATPSNRPKLTIDAEPAP